MLRLRSKVAPQYWHEHLNPSTAAIYPKVAAYFGGGKEIEFLTRVFSPAKGYTYKLHFVKKNGGGEILNVAAAVAEAICPPVYEVTTTN